MASWEPPAKVMFPSEFEDVAAQSSSKTTRIVTVRVLGVPGELSLPQYHAPSIFTPRVAAVRAHRASQHLVRWVRLQHAEQLDAGRDLD